MHRLLALLATLSVVMMPASAEEDAAEASQAASDRPVAIEKAEPEYPKKAYNKCIEGHVLVRFIIATDGTTKDIEVLSSRPERVFEKAAIAAVEKWRFEPRMLNGMPVQRESTQRLVFEPGCTR